MSLKDIWTGRTVVIIGSGPSLTAVDVRTVAKAHSNGMCRVIAVNDAVYLAWWADWLHACDLKWWQWNAAAGEAFGGIKTTLSAVPAPFGAMMLRNTGVDGFDPDPTACRTGSNSGFQAMHMAIHAGADRIVLLGFDMQGTHYFGDHPDRIRANWQALMVPKFETLRPELIRRGISVINCTPASALETFPRATLDAALSRGR